MGTKWRNLMVRARVPGRQYRRVTTEKRRMRSMRCHRKGRGRVRSMLNLRLSLSKEKLMRRRTKMTRKGPGGHLKVSLKISLDSQNISHFFFIEMIFDLEDEGSGRGISASSASSPLLQLNSAP